MRVLSGIQPSGDLHLGNYFGSIKPNLDLVGTAAQSFFFVADLHALTTVHDRAAMAKNRWNIVLDYLACGFDPERAIIYYQSEIPQHVELMWVLACLTPMGLLERAVSYKDKVQKGIAATAGLFSYPVLMAADILLYDANVVPVGQDQKQHLEIARDIALKFNATFGETLVVPEPLIRDEVAVVPGVDGQKMSKSYGNTLPLFGEPAAARKRIMGIVTDSRGASDPKDPDATTIYQLHRLFLAPPDAAALAQEYRAGLSYGEAKKRLHAAYEAHFTPLRERRAELESRPDHVRQVLAQGRRRASEIAAQTLDRVYRAIGMR